MTTEAEPRADDGAGVERKRKFKFPTAFTVLFFVLVLVWILTFIIKPGTYSYVSCDAGSPKPIPGTFENIDQNLSIQERVYDLWLSPVNGLYGIRTPAEVVPNPGSGLLKKAEAACGTVGGKQVPAEVVTPPGNTGPYNSGDLAGAVQVFFFVLAIGAFITVTIKTGALDAGIGRVTSRFRKRGLLLIVILAVIFSLGGTTYGMAEETLGFYAIILPVIIALGYDRLVGVGIIMVGAGVGTLASTVNPFATGVASDAAGLGEEGTVTGIISGAGDFIGAALIIAVARGVTTIMNNASITDSVLHYLEGAVSGLNSGAFAVVVYLVNIPLAFLVPSSSGHATLAMPIMAPLGDFAGVSRAMVVTGYQSASGWMNLFTPTSAVVMGGLALSGVRYDRYLRFVAPLLGILLILTCLFMLLGVAVPALGGSVK